MPFPGYSAALAVLRERVDSDLLAVLAAAIEPLGGSEPVLYLADYTHRALIPVTVTTGPVPDEEDIASTMAGRAFTAKCVMTAERDGQLRVWVPLVQGTQRTGVLALTMPAADEQTLAGLEPFGAFLGLVLAATSTLSDLTHLRRRSKPMSLAATMQWGLMPPLSAATDRGSIAGVLEPAYDIGGDAFDYAISTDVIDFAIIDGMGHGVASSMLTGLAVGAYRHARRANASVAQMHAAIDEAISDQYSGEAFATGILGRLSTVTGELDWSCAGHPPPLLLRGRKVVAELTCRPSLPFGLRDDAPAEVGLQALQPGDAVLLYTDGVIEARTSTGEEFGQNRLVDLLEREASSGRTGDELLRRLVASVLDYQVDALRDDATLMIVEWVGETPTAPS